MSRRHRLEVVVVEGGSQLFDSVVKGPAVVGRGAVVKNSYIGPHTHVGEGAAIYDSVVEGHRVPPGAVLKAVEVKSGHVLRLQPPAATGQEGGVVANSAVVGLVDVGHGSYVVNSVVRGPTAIGEGCEIKNSNIGPNVHIMDKARVYNSDINHL
ncbi:MAG: hypothetical protein ACK4M3_02440 [Pyrobaculum sp.]